MPRAGQDEPEFNLSRNEVGMSSDEMMNASFVNRDGPDAVLYWYDMDQYGRMGESRRPCVVQYHSVCVQESFRSCVLDACPMMPGLLADQPKELAQICAKASRTALPSVPAKLARP